MDASAGRDARRCEGNGCTVHFTTPDAKIRFCDNCRKRRKTKVTVVVQGPSCQCPNCQSSVTPAVRVSSSAPAAPRRSTVRMAQTSAQASNARVQGATVVDGACCAGRAAAGAVGTVTTSSATASNDSAPVGQQNVGDNNDSTPLCKRSLFNAFVSIETSEMASVLSKKLTEQGINVTFNPSDLAEVMQGAIQPFLEEALAGQIVETMNAHDSTSSTSGRLSVHADVFVPRHETAPASQRAAQSAGTSANNASADCIISTSSIVAEVASLRQRVAALEAGSSGMKQSVLQLGRNVAQVAVAAAVPGAPSRSRTNEDASDSAPVGTQPPFLGGTMQQQRTSREAQSTHSAAQRAAPPLSEFPSPQITLPAVPPVHHPPLNAAPSNLPIPTQQLHSPIPQMQSQRPPLLPTPPWFLRL